MQEPAPAEGEQSLAARLADEGALSAADALELAFPVLEAVIAAHAQGRPDGALDLTRILVRVRTDGGPRARIDSPADGEGAPRGRTGAFSSPEQARGGAADERSDQYAVGAILWACLAGRAPFAASESDALAAQIIAGLEPLAAVRAGVPARLAAVIERATTVDPGRRYTSVRALADALAEIAPPELRTQWLPRFDRPSIEPRSVADRREHAGPLARPLGPDAPRLVAPRTVLGALALGVVVAIAIVLWASLAGRG